MSRILANSQIKSKFLQNSNCLWKRVKSDSHSSKLAAAYNYKEVEDGRYRQWESQGHFSAHKTPSMDNSFSVLLPPPNVTGILHLGHALTCSIQDALIRWNRMNGKHVLWIPGLDHAGIATQTVVERHLAANKMGGRAELGREKFLDEAWKWKESKGDFIVEQIRNLGCSLDWGKQYFTLDKERSKAVVEAFIILFERGLIYRSESLVNWSCHLESAIADIEVDWLQLEEPQWIQVPGYSKKIKFGELTHVALPVENENTELVIATTRLETMLGDSAVAVNPKDARYSSFIGKFVKHPLRPGAKIPIISDDFVDPKFGTGVVKITPAHDGTDFEVGKRHGLEFLTVFSNEGKILPLGGSFDGLKRFDARKEVRKYLDSLGLIRGTSAVPNSKIPICSRSSDVIEIMLKPQWFINCKEMAVEAMKSVETGELVIDPPAFNKVWFSWLENIRDWCISRQLWWGHRIPAKRLSKRACEILKTDQVSVDQDKDVLDTWFSSALLPFASLGWPSSITKEYFPLSLMETGHDILFFWVARMVMLGKELTGELPFKKILLHGIICDSHGRKMSKSLGNVINPEDIIHGISLEDLTLRVKEGLVGSEQERKKGISAQKKAFPNGIPACGTDALRYTLCSHNAKVHYINFDVQECITNKHFCNKIWQATKYVLSNTSTKNAISAFELAEMQLSLMDRWILSRLSHTVDLMNAAFERENLHEACAAVKDFVYSNFCDIYIEASKMLLKDQNTHASCQQVLLHCVHTYLTLLAPFMPFLSEQLYQHAADDKKSIHANCYPSSAEWACFKNSDAEFKANLLIDTARAIRELKSMAKLSKQQTNVFIETAHPSLYSDNMSVLKMLGQCAELSVCSKIEPGAKTIKASLSSGTTVHVAGEVLLDFDDINRKIKKLRKEEENLVRTLSTSGFLEKAPKDVQESKRRKLQEIRLDIEKYCQQQRMDVQTA
ncbi:Hypothetical predicted protein [Cloeon dipterum]|uniref:Valine--tRNA ligase n=1 Tax=Cloeon dipterum TaxID=197152 RepID=A0A8S1CAT9_9INSE|nr:Hypothetical predicted protein [Cloeon dipterum]